MIAIKRTVHQTSMSRYVNESFKGCYVIDVTSYIVYVSYNSTEDCV